MNITKLSETIETLPKCNKAQLPAVLSAHLSLKEHQDLAEFRQKRGDTYVYAWISNVLQHAYHPSQQAQ